MEYGIVGCGSADASVVHEGLLDVRAKDSDAVFHVHARRSPQGAVGDVYDYLIDNEVPYIAHTRIDDKSPKILLDSALEVITTDDPLKSILEKCDQVLLLWDETNNESSEKIALMAADAGAERILDLTYALTPVVIESKEVEVVPQEDKELRPFSREELMNMNIGVLRRQAKSVGLDMGRASKEEIVDAMLGTTPDEAVEKSAPVTGGVWASDNNAIQIRIAVNGNVQELVLKIDELIDSGFLKPSIL